MYNFHQCHNHIKMSGADFPAPAEWTDKVEWAYRVVDGAGFCLCHIRGWRARKFGDNIVVYTKSEVESSRTLTLDQIKNNERALVMLFTKYIELSLDSQFGQAALLYR